MQEKGNPYQTTLSAINKIQNLREQKYAHYPDWTSDLLMSRDTPSSIRTSETRYHYAKRACHSGNQVVIWCLAKSSVDVFIFRQWLKPHVTNDDLTHYESTAFKSMLLFDLRQLPSHFQVLEIFHASCSEIHYWFWEDIPCRSIS